MGQEALHEKFDVSEEKAAAEAKAKKKLDIKSISDEEIEGGLDNLAEEIEAEDLEEVKEDAA